MEAKLSALLHLVGCTSPASRCWVPLSFSTFVSFRTELDFVCRGGRCRSGRARSRFPPRRSKAPHAGRRPRTGTHPASNGFPDPARLGAASHRSHAAASRRPSPSGRVTPGEEQRGRGRARRRPRPSRAAGPRPEPLPRPRTARNGGRATKWQPGGPRSGDPRRRQPGPRGHCSFPRCPCALRVLELHGKELGHASHPPLAPGPPSEDWHVRAPT